MGYGMGSQSYKLQAIHPAVSANTFPDLRRIERKPTYGVTLAASVHRLRQQLLQNNNLPTKKF